jgi:AcrR family transcriptional regulator
MSVGVKFDLNDRLFLRDPQSTELGCKIIEYSILMIHELGFEAFTFRKLAQRIKSTEASVYRYFENKHLLLIFLVSWYWEWVGYLIDINTINIEDPQKKLSIAIDNIVFASRENPAISYVNENILHRIVIAEGTKSYHTKKVDKENKEGFFLDYKRLTEKVSKIIVEMDPDFPYPRTLASNLLEMANNQIFFAEHLPRLTDVKLEDEDYTPVCEMMKYFTFRMLKANRIPQL